MSRDECEHGSLRRSCALCEAASQIRLLAAEVGALRGLEGDQRARALAAESALSEARAEVERLKKALALETHKVITCGVAASHPDAGLSLRGVYGGEWNSPQAEEVRTLRTNHDEARAALSEAREVVREVVDTDGRGDHHGFMSALARARSWLARLDAQGVTK